MPDNKHNYEYNYDLGDVIDNAVQMGSKIGSSVLGSIADALAIPGAADIESPHQSFPFLQQRFYPAEYRNSSCSNGNGRRDDHDAFLS